jgi:hypothetical protein
MLLIEIDIMNTLTVLCVPATINIEVILVPAKFVAHNRRFAKILLLCLL